MNKVYVIYLGGSPDEPYGVIFNKEDAEAYRKRFSSSDGKHRVDCDEVKVLTPDTTKSPWMDNYGTDEYEEERNV